MSVQTNASPSRVGDDPAEPQGDRGPRLIKQTPPFSEAVLQQRGEIPAIYGGVDFSTVPERFDSDATIDEDRFVPMRAAVSRVFERPALMDTIREATMKGDRTGDAYAALIPQLGFRTLVGMLETACAHGVESVADAPPELVSLISSMEATPEWIDMKLVEQGARAERIPDGNGDALCDPRRLSRNVPKQVRRAPDDDDGHAVR